MTTKILFLMPLLLLALLGGCGQSTPSASAPEQQAQSAAQAEAAAKAGSARNGAPKG